MRGMIVACAAVLVVTLSGCKEHGAVDEFGALADDFCACQSEACRAEVSTRAAAFDTRRLDPDRYTEVGDIAGRVHRCANRELGDTGAYSKPAP